MSETVEKLIEMALAAEKDDRLSDGALYGKLARALAVHRAALDTLVIIIRNRDQSEHEAKMLGYAKNVLHSDIDWTDEATALSSQDRGKTT